MDLDFEDSPSVRFWVSGRPSPGGSKRFVGVSKRTNRAILVDMGGKHTKNWRAAVAATAVASRIAPFAKGVPLLLKCTFTMGRPKKHFYTDRKRAGQLRSDAPHFHVSAPDTTKLTRSTEDALKGIAWADDSQVARQFGEKHYGDKPGCLIEIIPL